MYSEYNLHSAIPRFAAGFECQFVKDATHCHVSFAKITVTITSFKCSRRSAFSAYFVPGYDALWEVLSFEIPMLNCEFGPQSLYPARESFTELRLYPSHNTFQHSFSTCQRVFLTDFPFPSSLLFSFTVSMSKLIRM